MCKSIAMTGTFVLYVLFLGIISVQRTTGLGEITLPETLDQINSSMFCVLFANGGCSLECILTTELYGFQSYGGVCIHNQICSCNNKTPPPPTSMYEVWRKKFNSDYVYDQIIKNDTLYQQAAKILGKAGVTAYEQKQLLKPILSPYQYARLQTDDRSLAAQFIKNGKVQIEPFRKHVSNQLENIFKYRNNRFPLYINYQYRFRQTLANVRDRGTLYNFAYKVSCLQNKTVQNVFEEYLKKNNIKKPEVKLGEEPQIYEDLCYTILDELIKRNNAARRV